MEKIHWTVVLSVSELEEKAKQFWTEKSMGGATPNEKDMFIAGFRLGVQMAQDNPEIKALMGLKTPTSSNRN